MWTRRQLKDKAKQVLNRSYWKMVLVSVIATILLTGAPSINLNFGTEGLPISVNENKLYWDGNEDYCDFEVVIDDVMPYLPIISFVVITIVAIALGVSIFLANPLLMGARYFFYRSLKEEEKIKVLLRAFSDRYLHIVKTLFLTDLYITLWSLLFVIPGVIKS